MRSLKDFLDNFLYVWMGVRGGRRISETDREIVRADEQDICSDD